MTDQSQWDALPGGGDAMPDIVDHRKVLQDALAEQREIDAKGADNQGEELDRLRAENRRLRQQVQNVRGAHHPDSDLHGEFCATDRQPWPCFTIRMMTE